MNAQWFICWKTKHEEEIFHNISWPSKKSKVRKVVKKIGTDHADTWPVQVDIKSFIVEIFFGAVRH